MIFALLKCEGTSQYRHLKDRRKREGRQHQIGATDSGDDWWIIDKIVMLLNNLIFFFCLYSFQSMTWSPEKQFCEMSQTAKATTWKSLKKYLFCKTRNEDETTIVWFQKKKKKMSPSTKHGWHKVWGKVGWKQCFTVPSLRSVLCHMHCASAIMFPSPYKMNGHGKLSRHCPDSPGKPSSA